MNLQIIRTINHIKLWTILLILIHFFYLITNFGIVLDTLISLNYSTMAAFTFGILLSMIALICFLFNMHGASKEIKLDLFVRAFFFLKLFFIVQIASRLLLFLHSLFNLITGF